MTDRPTYIASCSFGKDSLATILLALEHNEPLDRAVFCEVMFDHERGISGELPELIEQLLYEGSFSMWIGFEGEQKEYRIVTAEDLWEANEAYCAIYISCCGIGKA